MKIGITYDLKEDYLREGYSEEDAAEFDCAETIQAIDSSLHSLGHATDRIGHVRSLAGRLVQGERWDLCGGRVQDQSSQPVTLTCPCDELARQCRGYAAPAPFGCDSQPANFANIPRVDPCPGGGQTTEFHSVDRS